MAWEDRPYYRDRSAGGSSLARVLGVSAPVARFFGLQLRMHSSLIVLIVAIIAIPMHGCPIGQRAFGCLALLLVLLIHEIAHIAAARIAGGSGDEIVLWPLGGLEYPQLPRRTRGAVFTIAAGPFSTAAICTFTGLLACALAPDPTPRVAVVTQATATPSTAAPATAAPAAPTASTATSNLQAPTFTKSKSLSVSMFPSTNESSSTTVFPSAPTSNINSLTTNSSTGASFSQASAVPILDFNPLHTFNAAPDYLNVHNPALYFRWFFEISFLIFIANLLPIFPLDGGHLLQTVLTPGQGAARATQITAALGSLGALLLLAIGGFSLNLLLITAGICAFLYCRQRAMELRERAQESVLPGGLDFGAALFGPPNQRPRKHLSRRAIWRARRIVQREAAERSYLDGILAKVSAHGIASLTWRERHALRKATALQRQREDELSNWKE